MRITVHYCWALIILPLMNGDMACRKVDNCLQNMRSSDGGNASELARWGCLRSLLFPSNPTENRRSVFHDCGGLGWGNSIRALYSTVALALVMDRTVHIVFDPFHRMFELPSDVPLETAPYSESRRFRNHHISSQFDYEKHGRNPGRFATWVTAYENNQTDALYDKPIVYAGLCGGEREFITDNLCLQRLLPKFYACARSLDSRLYMHDHLLSVPFFHILFRKPTEILANNLNIIRDRLNLSYLPEGLEEHPGLWGLRTPGKYIFAMHFRNVPLGFEHSSVQMNREGYVVKRRSLLDAFWNAADVLIAKALRIAKCRGEELLIYFATDDVYNLRPVAEEKFAKYGRVVGGLIEEEVGHVSPQWRGDEAESQRFVNASEYSTIHYKSADPISQRVHADMSLVEWWILANSNWLLCHSGTSYSETAASYGLGPGGVMERIDIVNGMNHILTSKRRDWDDDSCSPVVAVNAKHFKSCPNI